MKFFGFFKKTLPESPLVQTDVDGTPQLIHKETREVFNRIFLKPTPENPQLGFCLTCKDRIRFMDQLMDMENPNSCFMLSHLIEPIGGRPWHETKDFQKAMDQQDYEMWKTGGLEL